MSTPEYDTENIFAKILRGEIPCFKVYEDDRVLAFMDIMPRGEGHALVIPKEPCRNMLDASPQAVAHVHQTAQKIALAAIKAFDADGITIQQFSEDASGQEVYHYHVHVVPRHDGRKFGAANVMGDMEVIKANGEKLAAAISA